MEEHAYAAAEPALGDAKDRIDRMPSTPQEWSAFAALPAQDRIATYLRSIRSMLLFFTVLGIVAVIGVLVTGLASR